MDDTPTDTPTDRVNRDPSRAYTEAFPAWQQLSQRAGSVLAAGAMHDSQLLGPIEPFFDRAQGPYKWSGARRFVDYWSGHGSLLMGHAFPPVVTAVAQQVQRGSHFGGMHENVLRWAELVCELVPSAERVRFTSSGTEATLLALRVARAFTARRWVLKFEGHFHGWHDEVMAGAASPASSGVNAGALTHVAVRHTEDLGAVSDFLAREPVAAVILEPGGAAGGMQPWSRDFLQGLREVTRRRDTLLIFDEVISGFRYGPGGIQGLCGVTPDLTVLGKILAGGLPGAAVVGRADVMAVFGNGVQIGDRHVRVPHTGTFNGNPVSAAAGVAMLEHVRDGVAQEAARRAAARLAAGVDAAAEAAGLDLRMRTHDSSIFHVDLDGLGRFGQSSAGSGAPAAPGSPGAPQSLLFGKHRERYAALRRALLIEGVDCHPLHGWVSAVHDDEAIELTVAAFARALARLASAPA
ncbi:MAG TPA: aminotransferase class III-fold pyridoxal phosphate-dependent enzyme [Haliangium sp.]|nr:aminotransferase class III-fold pyridoxal phosphate-dependent enzyme [Haliangium sp.]